MVLSIDEGGLFTAAGAQKLILERALSASKLLYQGTRAPSLTSPESGAGYEEV
jgi:hypothetical protein